MPEFGPHGEYRIETDGQILKVYVRDTANRELMEAYTRDVARHVAAFGGRPFAHYLEYVTDALLIEESIGPLKVSLRERMSQGLCAVAFNVSGTTAPSVLGVQTSRIYDDVGLPCAQFDGYERARPWLLERIAEVEAARPGGGPGRS